MKKVQHMDMDLSKYNKTSIASYCYPLETYAGEPDIYITRLDLTE